MTIVLSLTHHADAGDDLLTSLFWFQFVSPTFLHNFLRAHTKT